MGAPATLALGTAVNGWAEGVRAGLYVSNTFTITHHIPAGSLISWVTYDWPGWEKLGEVAEAQGVIVKDSKGNGWGGLVAAPPKEAEGARILSLLPVALNEGDTVTVTTYAPMKVGEVYPLSMVASVYAVDGLSGATFPRLLIGAYDFPAGGSSYRAGLNNGYKGNAGQPGRADEIVEQWLQDNEVPSFGPGEVNYLGQWFPEAFGEKVESVSLEEEYAPSGAAPILSHTITSGDSTLGEGVLKHGGWRLDIYVKIPSDYLADAGNVLSECMADGSATSAYPPWAVNGRNGEHPHALHLLAPILDHAIYGSSVEELLNKIVAEGTIPTRPEQYDTHLKFQQVGITDVRGRVCGSAPYDSGHGASYWLATLAGPIAPLTVKEPDTGDLYVGGVLKGKGIPLEWTEANAITGIEAVATGKKITPPPTEHPGEEVVGGETPLTFEGAVCPYVTSVFNTLTFTWEAHIVVYFPPDIAKEEAEKRAKEQEAQQKLLEEEAAKKEKEAEEKAKKEKEEAEKKGGEPAPEVPPAETEAEKKLREEREAEEAPPVGGVGKTEVGTTTPSGVVRLPRR